MAGQRATSLLTTTDAITTGTTTTTLSKASHNVAVEQHISKLGALHRRHSVTASARQNAMGVANSQLRAANLQHPQR